MDPLPIYEQWWKETEQCTGKTYPYENIHWFKVKAGWGDFGTAYECPWTIGGVCFAQVQYLDENRGVIYISEGRLGARSTVTHEAVHVLTRKSNSQHNDPEFCYCTLTDPDRWTQEQKDSICTGAKGQTSLQN